MTPTIVKYNETKQRSANEFNKDGYKFAGWTAGRTSFGSTLWLCSDGNWHTEEEIAGNGYIKDIYNDEQEITNSKLCHHSIVQLYAQWIKIERNNQRAIKQIVENKKVTYLVVEKGTTVENLLEDLSLENFELVIKKGNTNLSENDMLKTDEKVTTKALEKDLNIVIVVKGDVNSDGGINFYDVLKLNNYRLNKNTEKYWSESEKLAFKVLKPTTIENTDISQIFFKDIILLNNYRLRK